MQTYPSFLQLPQILLTTTLVVALSACTLPNAPTTKAAAKASGSFSSGETLEVLLALNNGEIRQAELVPQKSRNQQVQDTARIIIDDHTRANKMIDSIVQSGVKLEKSPLSRGLKAQAEEIREDLSKLSSTEFDCTYLQKQIDQHELALETVRSELQPDAEEQRIKNILSTVETALERHLQHAQKARKSLNQCPED